MTYSIRQVAERIGISEALLILWIATGKVKPSIELSTAASVKKLQSKSNHKNQDYKPPKVGERYVIPKPTAGSPDLKRMLETYAPDGEIFGWNRFAFSDEDLAKLRTAVEITATQKDHVNKSHVPGQYYTVQEVAKLWGLGVDKTRELVENEPDVIKLKSDKKRKRKYVTLRIPEKVVDRLQRRLS